MFREEYLYKNLVRGNGEKAVVELSEVDGVIRNSVEVFKSSGTTTQCQD